MGFGDAAKAALSKAVEALQAIAEIRAIVQQVQSSVTSFEERIQSRLDALEARVRELERENAKLHGQVQAAYGDALKMLILDAQHRGRALQADDHSDGPRVLRDTALPDSAGLPSTK
jgi:hypothetical protein